LLIVFSGRPGSGKSTIARRLVMTLSATYLRVDEIEQAIGNADVSRGEIGAAGYEVANALSRSNLRLGNVVVVDCVNPVSESRLAFQATGRNAECAVINVEIVCSDPVEHRRRIETREAEIPGHKLPTWRDVMRQPYEAWTSPRLLIDTATIDAPSAAAMIVEHLHNIPAEGGETPFC